MFESVSASATWIVGVGDINCTNFPSCDMNGKIINIPQKLNMKLVKAVNFALPDMRRLTINAVDVVPTLAPTIMGMAASKDINPWATKTITRPTTTELDWMITVIMMPASTPMKGFVAASSISTTRGSSRIGSNASLMRLREKKIKPK